MQKGIIVDLKFGNTHRGFTLIEFSDRYDNDCSMQDSSLATESAIWFGINDGNPQIMASKASQFGIETTETTGWIPYPIPEEVILHTRMHLSREQVEELIPILQNFVRNGCLPKTLPRAVEIIQQKRKVEANEV